MYFTLQDNNARSMAIFKFYPFVDSNSFFSPCRYGKALLVSWSTLYMVTGVGSGVYSTGVTMSSVGLRTKPSGLLTTC